MLFCSEISKSWTMICLVGNICHEPQHMRWGCFLARVLWVCHLYSHVLRDFSHLGLAQEISGFLVLILGFRCWLICYDDFQQLFWNPGFHITAIYFYIKCSCQLIDKYPFLFAWSFVSKPMLSARFFFPIFSYGFDLIISSPFFKSVNEWSEF